MRYADFSENIWAWGLARCHDRVVLMIQRRVGEANRLPRWKVTDTLLLPPVTVTDLDPHRRCLVSAWDGTCELSAHPKTEYIATVRFGDHYRVDWRTGVEQAWTFDLQQGRIVLMWPEGIVCELLEP